MKKTCDVCGFEYEGNRDFCDACGTPIPDAKGNTFQEEIPVVELIKEKKTETTDTNNDKVVGVGTYLGLTVLFVIPVIGLIICIIMVCAAKNKNLKNYATAMLIWLVITLLAGGVFVFAAFKVLKTVEKRIVSYEKQIEETDKLFDSLGGLGDLLENYGEVSGIMEEFENIEDLGDVSDVLEGLGDLGDLGESLDGLGDLGDLGDLGEAFDALGKFGDSLEGTDDLDLGGLLDDLGGSDLGDLLNNFGF